MPQPLYDIIADLYTECVGAQDDCYAVGNQLNLAGNALREQNFTEAGNRLKSAGGYAQTLSQKMHGQYTYYHYYLIDALEWINEYWPSAPAITWEAICEAWVSNDFEGKEWTIACIDQMRKLMWDEPFDIRWAENPIVKSK